MTTSLARGLVTAATALSGVVAGTTIDTAIVKLPSWHRLGAELWAAYTREELPTSLVWYPVLGIGVVLTNLAAAVTVHRDDGATRSAALPSRVVALLATGHLLTTALAVVRGEPVVAHVGNEIVARDRKSFLRSPSPMLDGGGRPSSNEIVARVRSSHRR